MESIHAAMRSLDFSLITSATQWTAGSDGHSALVYIVAELLIFLFPLVLLYLWEQPHHARGDRYGSKKAAMMAVMSVIIALAFKALIAVALFRARPFISHPDLYFLHFHVDSSSFPSSHAMITFAIASSLYWSGYKKRGLVLLVLAFFIALARVFAGVHYPSDILAGAIVGVFCAWYMHSEASSLRKYLPDK